MIGRQGKNIPLAQARDYILGYACGNDVTARDIQNAAPNQLIIAKSFGVFCPLEPWIVTDFDQETSPRQSSGVLSDQPISPQTRLFFARTPPS